MKHKGLIRLLLLTAVVAPASLLAQGGRGGGRAADSIKYVYAGTPQLEKLKAEAAALVDGEAKQIQEMVDMVFSFGELLEHLSRDLPFVPGDLIFGGTGAGTAQDSTKLNPDGTRPKDRFLARGHVVEVSSPRIGALTNTIV